MPPAAEDEVADGDVILNRYNVAHARSSRVLQSWLPSKSEPESTVEISAEDDDLTSLTETGGFGSKTAHDDESGALDGLARRKTTSQDALMEHILGKKEAQMKRKRDAESARDMKTGKLGMAKPLMKAQKADQVVRGGSEDEEEGDRATAFTSRSGRSVSRKAERVYPTQTSAESGVVAQTMAASDKMHHEDDRERSDNESEVRPTKRSKGSYLDEMLAKNSSKRSKKGKQATNG